MPLALKDSVAVMKKMGKAVPKKIKEMLNAGFESFYQKREDGKYYYDFNTKNYVKLEDNPKIIFLPELKERNKIVSARMAAPPSSTSATAWPASNSTPR